MRGGVGGESRRLLAGQERQEVASLLLTDGTQQADSHDRRTAWADLLNLYAGEGRKLRVDITDSNSVAPLGPDNTHADPSILQRHGIRHEIRMNRSARLVDVLQDPGTTCLSQV